MPWPKNSSSVCGVPSAVRNRIGAGRTGGSTSFRPWLSGASSPASGLREATTAATVPPAASPAATRARRLSERMSELPS